MQEQTNPRSWASSISRATAKLASYFNPFKEIFTATFFLTFPNIVRAEEYHLDVNCFYRSDSQELYCLSCCNGQETELTQRIETSCGMTHINLEGIKKVAIQDYGLLQDNRTACRLYLAQTNAAPCVTDILQRDVISGQPNTCINMNWFTFGIPLATVTTVICFVGYRYYRRRFFPQVDQSAENNRAAEIPEQPNAIRFREFSERLEILMAKDIPEFNQTRDELKQDFDAFEKDTTCPIAHAPMTEPVGLKCAEDRPDHPPQPLHYFDMTQLLNIPEPCVCPVCRAPFNPDTVEVDDDKKAQINGKLDELSDRLKALEEHVLPLANLNVIIDIGNNEEPVAEVDGDVEMRTVERRISLGN